MALYRRARSTRLLVSSLVMASLLIITLDYRGGAEGPFAAAGRGLFAVVSPMQEAVSNVVRPVSDWISGIFHVGSLRAENELLREQLREQLADAAGVAALEQEIAELQAIVGVQQASSVPTVAATVIGASVGNFEWTVTINVGSSDGVAVDMAVRNADGLVGHVIQVSSLWSKIQLIIDPQSKVGGRLARSGETGLVEGKRDQDLAMGLVDNTSLVSPDEQVLTSGYQGGVYPPGILIGVVSHVYQDPGSLSKQVSIRPAVDFSALRYVLVLLGSPVGVPE